MLTFGKKLESNRMKNGDIESGFNAPYFDSRMSSCHI